MLVCLVAPTVEPYKRQYCSYSQLFEWISAADAHTVSTQRRGNAAVFLFYSLLSFLLFILCICHSDRAFSFLGFLNSLSRTGELILCYPDRKSVCTHSCHFFGVVFSPPRSAHRHRYTVVHATLGFRSVKLL